MYILQLSNWPLLYIFILVGDQRRLKRANIRIFIGCSLAEGVFNYPFYTSLMLVNSPSSSYLVKSSFFKQRAAGNLALFYNIFLTLACTHALLINSAPAAPTTRSLSLTYINSNCVVCKESKRRFDRTAARIRECVRYALSTSERNSVSSSAVNKLNVIII